MSEEIAEITWNPETMRIVDTVFLKKDLRFKCKRCAVFCCKLGGPQVTEKDTKRLEEAGYEAKDFLVKEGSDETWQKFVRGLALRQNEDGSCIFLGFDSENEVYNCSIYKLRPTLCRLYPFEFERLGPNSLLLKIIPCCNGLNAPNGESVDKNFIEEKLLKAMLELLKDGQA